uniref:Putative secreted protein salivary gland overexpressed n=1 Tax=Rhipicephalus microplus TaxID=6941 RepID=A0A6M2DDD9_RHIMP
MNHQCYTQYHSLPALTMIWITVTATATKEVKLQVLIVNTSCKYMMQNEQLCFRFIGSSCGVITKRCN